MSSKNLLKILFLEDLPSDAELAIMQLMKEGLSFEHLRVDTKVEFINALRNFRPDIVISDYMLPAYNGLQALLDKIEIDPLLPFILYTGSINEEIAVQCMKAGATDYIIKEHMTRLPFAVKEALEQALIQKEKRAADLLLNESEEKMQSIFRAAPVGIGLSVENIIIEVNDTFCKMTGYNRKELIGKHSEMLYASNEISRNAAIEKYRQIDEIGTGSVETLLKCKDGCIINILICSTPLDKKDLSKGYTFTILDITARKKAEIALSESEDRFRNLYNEAVVGLYRTNSKGQIMLANRFLVKMLGFASFEELASINLNNTGVGTTYQRQKFIDQIEKEGEVTDLEAIWICRDGKEIFVRESAKAIRDSEGKIIYYDGTVEDITERKRAQEALSESETKYRQLVTRSPDGIFIVDLSGKFLSLNSAICDNLKYTEAELLSMKIWDIVPERYHSLHKQRLMLIMKGESTNDSAEYDVIGKDGIAHAVEVLSVPYYKGKEIIGFQGIARDVTERKQVKEALRESEQRYRELFLNNPAPTYIFDVQTLRFIEVNEAAISIYGFSREEFAGMTLKDLRLDEDLPALLDSLNELGDNTFHSTSMRHRRKDGTIFPVEITSHALPEKNGKKTRLVIATDITERLKAAEQMKLAKEKAEASDNLKTTFLNNISHEVRTPLNGILGFAEIMSQADLSEEEKRESLKMLSDSSDRLLGTITNYMDISLVTSGAMTVFKKDFSPVQVLTKIFDYHKEKCSTRGLDLFLQTPEQSADLNVNSDPEILRKILSHLLNNAIKFTEKGAVKYGFNFQETDIEFFVTDTGIGIGKESLEIIFDHFVKEDRGPLKLTEGSGLGLSISRGMVDLLGGKIRVDSEEGKGSSFFFTIPYKNEVRKNYSIDQVTPQVTHKNKNSILVAEDDETNFFYLQALLRQNTSAVVIHASNGREAVDLFMQNPDIGLILMDIKMPVMNGLEATRLIKAINPHIPVIAITAYAMSGDEARILASGCDFYLTKPVNRKILLEKIAEYIKI